MPPGTIPPAAPANVSSPISAFFCPAARVLLSTAVTSPAALIDEVMFAAYGLPAARVCIDVHRSWAAVCVRPNCFAVLMNAVSVSLALDARVSRYWSRRVFHRVSAAVVDRSRPFLARLTKDASLVPALDARVSRYWSRRVFHRVCASEVVRCRPFLARLTKDVSL